MKALKLTGLVFIILAIQGCFTDKQCLCPELYAPVCGDDGKTYSNSCLAECEEVRYYDGECPVNGIGQVIFSGDSLCGYLIGILNEVYKPDTLSPEFRQDNIFISLRYRRLNNYYTCEEPYGHFQRIQILNIDEILK